MKYIIDDNLEDIMAIYPEIFLTSFPQKSYDKKLQNGNWIIKVKFIEDGKTIGFCLVNDKPEDRRLHCWIGGVLPEFRKNGVFSGFIDWIVRYAFEKKYDCITLNTDNNKPAIIRMLVKYGFRIINVTESEYGDGNKIHFIFDIHSERKMRLSITDYCNLDCFFCHSEGNFSASSNNIPLSAIEQLLIQAQRMNFSEITITGGEPLIYFEGVRLILEHCNSWTHLPKIKLCTNGIALDEQKISILKQYEGKIELNISLHTVNGDVMSKITRVEIDPAKYEKLFQCLEKNSIGYRVNSVLLKGINTDQQSLTSFFDFLFDNNVKAVHLLELLVKKDQKDFYRYYESIEEIEKKMKALSSMFNIKQIEKTNKKTVYILQRDDKFIKVILFRLSSRCGCSGCTKENDIKIGADMILHPCYLKDVNCGNAVMNLEKAIKNREEYMKSQEMDYSYNTLYWGK